MTQWFKSSYSGGDNDCVEVAHLFRTSSYSTAADNCVEVAHLFRKSSFSTGSANCVEIADSNTAGAIRDTKHRDLGALVFPSAEWRAFVSAVKARDL